MNCKWIPIAKTTLRELFRSKVLYGVFGIVIFLELIATAFGNASIGDLSKIVKDFGLFLITVSTASLATISGSSLMYKEVSRKTIYNILSKPVSRFDFVFGKFLGIFFLCLTVIASLTTVLIIYASLFDGSIDWNIAVASVYITYEVIVVCALSMFCSSIVATPGLSGILSFSLFLIGRGLLEIYGLTQNQDIPAIVQQICKISFWVLPQTFRFTVSNDIVYGIVPSISHTMGCFFYAVSYALLLLILSTTLFSRKDFN